MSDPSARVVRLASPVASPGHCVICGKTSHPEGFADARLDFEFYGTAYFCADCVGDYARLFGYASPNEVTRLREHIVLQDAELNTLRQANSGLESTVDSLIADAHRRSTQRAESIGRGKPFSGTGDAIQRPVDQPDAGLPVSNPAKPSVPLKQAEPTPAQSSVEQGPNDLLDTSTADELLGL